MLKIYLLKQSINDGYEAYDSCVVAAESEEEARKIHPNGDQGWNAFHDWVKKDQTHLIEVTEIGTAKTGINRGVLCASFKAG